MKKLFVLFALGFIILLPKDVNAAQIQRVFSGNTAQWDQQQGYYYGLPDVHNRMPYGYLTDYRWSHYFPSDGYYYTLRPIDTSVNFIYAVKQVCLFSDVAVNNGKVYTIDLNFVGGSYMKIGSWDTSLYGFEVDSSCASNKGACSMVWNGATARITFVPNQNTSSYYICVGSYTNENKAIAFNNNTRYEQGIEIRSSTITHDDSSVDLSPIVNQQITTNNKIDQTNQKLDSTNEKLDSTNEKLTDINDTLSNGDVDNDVADGFFDSLSFNENDTLQGVLTAPFRFINKLTEMDSCQPVRLTYRSAVIDIPCGTTLFWNREDIQNPFRRTWNLLFGGLLIYRLLLKLFKVVNDVLDPRKDNLEGVDI